MYVALTYKTYDPEDPSNPPLDIPDELYDSPGNPQIQPIEISFNPQVQQGGVSVNNLPILEASGFFRLDCVKPNTWLKKAVGVGIYARTAEGQVYKLGAVYPNWGLRTGTHQFIGIGSSSIEFTQFYLRIDRYYGFGDDSAYRIGRIYGGLMVLA